MENVKRIEWLFKNDLDDGELRVSSFAADARVADKGTKQMRWSEHPLEADIWFQRIEMIRNGELPSTENALRHALHLLQLTPHELRPRERPDIDEEGYEGLLVAGEFEQAARVLVSAPTLSVTTTPAGDCVRVGVKCSAMNHTLFGEGPTVADAILQVWSEYLLLLQPGKSESWVKIAERR